MARYALALVAAVTLFFSAGCGSGQARTGLRNAVVAAQSLQHNPDPAVQAAGRAIEVQVEAAADQFDEVLWGLWTDKSHPSIQIQDWEESWNSALRRSLAQAEATRQETLDNHTAIQAATGLLGALGLPLGAVGGTGLLAFAGFLMKNKGELQAALKTAVGYGHEIAACETDDEVKVVKAKYRPLANRHLKAAIASTVPVAKV